MSGAWGATVKKLLAGCLLASLAMIVVAPALAQKVPPPAVAILDVRRLLNDSLAAKSIRPQIARLRKDFQREIRDRESALRKAEQDLLGQRAILAPEAFAKRRRQFEARARKAQQEVQTRKQAIDRALSLAMRRIRIAISTVAGKIATENKINIVMLKSAVLMSATNLEITAETLKRLNKQLPKVKVEFAKKK